MPTTCWAEALALISAAALAASPVQASGEPGTAPLLQATQAAPGKTRLRLALPGRPPQTLVMARDEDVPDAAAPLRTDVLAVIDNNVVVLADSYPSRLNQGAGACGAGEERFLRVVRVAPPPAALTYSLRLASCWKNVELDDEFVDPSGAKGWRWTPATQELRIEWFSGPTKQAPEVRRLRIEADGRVTEVKPG